MAVQVSTCLAHIQQTLGEEISSGVSALSVLNQAGRHLVSMRGWKFLESPPAQLSLVSGQGWIDMPSDFAELISYSANVNTITGLRLTSLQEIVSLRAYGGTYMGYLAGAFVRSDGDTPRIEIAPVPASSTSNALTIIYRKKWTEVVDDDTTITLLPDFTETLMLLICRAFARAYEEEDLGQLDIRLEPIARGATYAACIEHDYRIQPDYGPISGGGASMADAALNAGIWGWPPTTDTVPPP